MLSLSWSMLEAMAAGCVVIGFRTAPVEEVVQDGENGLLVDFFSAQEIADRVDAVCDGGVYVAGIGEKARGTVVEGYDLRGRCLPGQVEVIAELASGENLVNQFSIPMMHVSERSTKNDDVSVCQTG